MSLVMGNKTTQTNNSFQVIDNTPSYKDPSEFYDEDVLNHIDENLSGYVQSGDHYLLEDEDVIDFVDRYMEYDNTFDYTRVKPLDMDDYEYYMDLEGKSFEFKNYYESFSSTIQATHEIMDSFSSLGDNVVIYRVNNQLVQHFNMLDYSDGYEYQAEHLLHGFGWTVDKVTDVSNDYPNRNVLIVDLSPSDENFVEYPDDYL